MKHFFKVALFSFIVLFGVRSLHAQKWERIGWQGGDIYPSGQLGHTLYGISESAVYKSVDWGNTWTIFITGLPKEGNFYYSLNFTQFQDQIGIDISENGSQGAGIYYSKENDNSWSFKKMSLISGVTPKILYWTADSVFAYRDSKGFDDLDGYYFSQNGGANWKIRMQGVPSPSNSYAFSSGSHFYLAFYNPREYFHTGDFGISWNKIDLPENGAGEQVIYPVQDSVFLAFPNYANIYRSSDYGSTWNLQKNTFQPMDLRGITFIKQIGNKTCLFSSPSSVGKAKFFTSEDLGINWKQQISQDSTITSMTVYGDNDHYIGKIYRYTGTNFYPTSLYSMNSAFDSLHVLTPTGNLSNGRHLLCVREKKLFTLPIIYNKRYYDSLFVSEDNAETWNQKIFLSGSMIDDHHWMVNNNKLYASGITADSLPCIFQSADNGDTWAKYLTIPFSREYDISNYVIRGDTIMLQLNGPSGKSLLVSIDHGSSWVYLNIQPVNPTIVFKNGMFGLTSFADNKFFFSFDLLNWSEAVFSDYPVSVGGGYIFGNRLFAEFHQSFNDLVYRTKDNPVWRKCKPLDITKSVLPTCDDGSVLFAPVFSSTCIVNISYDSGFTWKQLGDGVTSSKEVFIGSEYIFFAGDHELWRIPKSTASVTPSAQTNPSLFIYCFPNPAATETRITYSLPKRGDILLRAFDMTGKLAATIASETDDGGSHEVNWDTRSLPSGSYVIELSAWGERVSKVVEVSR